VAIGVEMLNRPERMGWARKLRKHRLRLTGSAPIIRGAGSISPEMIRTVGPCRE
jgi:hypothetical protein